MLGYSCEQQSRAKKLTPAEQHPIVRQQYEEH